MNIGKLKDADALAILRVSIKASFD